VFGVLQSVHKLYASLFPAAAILVFDGGLSERRRALYPEYKKYAQSAVAAKREAEAGERQQFYDQKGFISTILRGFGIPTLEFPGREADDVILHAAHYLPKLGLGITKIAVISEDMDLCQCIQCSVHGECEVELHRPVRDLVLTRNNLDVHLGYPRQYYKWYKALVGKPREVQGIPGIGEKTAVALINEAHAQDKTLIELVEGRKGKRYETLSASIHDFYTGLAIGDLFLEELTVDERAAIFAAVLMTTTCDDLLEASKATARRLEFHSIVDEWDSWTKPFMDAIRGR